MTHALNAGTLRLDAKVSSAADVETSLGHALDGKDVHINVDLIPEHVREDLAKATLEAMEETRKQQASRRENGR
jgi:hypothetical protein